MTLEQKATIPEVIAAKETLAKAKSDTFWNTATLPEIDKIREEMRGLMHFLKREIHTADDEDIPLGKFVRSLTGLDKATAEQAFNEFLDTGLYTQEQITFVRYIIDWLVQYGTLARQEMAYDEFSGGMDVTEVFEDNIILFQRIMTVVDNINANAMPLAA